MARIASLNVLLQAEGKDFLAEQYGAVIDNIQKTTISQRLKNTNLSGNPESGTVEAKRFVNRTSNAYGTARTGGKGQEVKSKPVTVSIDQDKELVTEVENKDVTMYGVDNFVERQVASDGKSMGRELERAFFSEAKTAGTEVTLTGSTPEEIAEEMIQRVETVKNDFVDGVERDMIALVCAPKFFGKLRTYLDKVQDGGAKGEEIGYFHGVEVHSSVYLPDGADIIAMADGSIAEPVRTSLSAPAKIQLSDAIGFGLFFYYGVKAVSEDLIFWAALPQG